MHAVGAGIVLRLVTVINRSWPVTVHDDQRPVEKEGRDGGPLKLLTWPFGCWTIDSSLSSSTACFGGCSPNTGERKLKIESFWWGGRFGRSLLCPGRAEKKTRGSCPPTRCLPVDRNKLGPDSWRDEKGVWYRTHRHTHKHTHTHIHEIKAVWTARAPALARTWPPARIKHSDLRFSPNKNMITLCHWCNASTFLLHDFLAKDHLKLANSFLCWL